MMILLKNSLIQSYYNQKASLELQISKAYEKERLPAPQSNEETFNSSAICNLKESIHQIAQSKTYGKFSHRNISRTFTTSKIMPLSPIRVLKLKLKSLISDEVERIIHIYHIGKGFKGHTIEEAMIELFGNILGTQEYKKNQDKISLPSLHKPF
jgi:hypothetical protein